MTLFPMAVYLLGVLAFNFINEAFFRSEEINNLNREKAGIVKKIDEFRKYIPTMGQTFEKVILTTVYICKTTHSPVYMDNRAYVEIG